MAKWCRIYVSVMGKDVRPGLNGGENLESQKSLKGIVRIYVWEKMKLTWRLFIFNDGVKKQF